MLQDKAENIFVKMNNVAFEAMMEETSLWPGKETGGMIFGRLLEREANITIEMIKTYIPPQEVCTRKTSFFEIDPEYAKEIVRNEELAYLGNWHVHLGYGGPSYGDLRQIEGFFAVNPHLDIITTFIIDFHTIEKYELIIEVYKRIEDDLSSSSKNFETYRIPQKNISFFSEKIKSLRVEKGISREKIELIKREILNITKNTISIDEILDYEGSIPYERIISFPYQFLIDNNKKKIVLRLLILVSFPPEFPDGMIFIDISSQDLSKNITFEKHPAAIVADNELITPFFQSLRASLEDEVHLLLKEPLWKVLGSSK